MTKKENCNNNQRIEEHSDHPITLIEFRNIEKLYELTKELLNKELNVKEILSSTIINKKLNLKEKTEFYTSEKSEFHLQTTLELGSSQESPFEVIAIQSLLKNLGYKIKLETEGGFGEKKILSIESENTVTRIDFGYSGFLSDFWKEMLNHMLPLLLTTNEFKRVEDIIQADQSDKDQMENLLIYLKNLVPDIEEIKNEYLTGETKFSKSEKESVQLSISTSEKKQSTLNREKFVKIIELHSQIYNDILNYLKKIGLIDEFNKKILPIIPSENLKKTLQRAEEIKLQNRPQNKNKKTTSFSEVAGQDEAVEEAKKMSLLINYPEIFLKRGVKKPNGILFYGPPGTGKTLLVKAIATAIDAKFVTISGADINSKWFGESEQNMQKIFDEAKKETFEGKKIIIFFDEIDAIGKNRDTSYHTDGKVLSILLQNLDGFRKNNNITILAATNKLDDVDPALKRAGRIDKLIHMPLPDSEGRIEIANVHIEKAKKRSTGLVELFEKEINVELLSRFTEGMSGAEIENLINLSLETKAIEEVNGKEWSPISTDYLLSVGQKFKLLKSFELYL